MNVRWNDALLVCGRRGGTVAIPGEGADELDSIRRRDYVLLCRTRGLRGTRGRLLWHLLFLHFPQGATTCARYLTGR